MRRPTAYFENTADMSVGVKFKMSYTVHVAAIVHLLQNGLFKALDNCLTECQAVPITVHVRCNYYIYRGCTCVYSLASDIFAVYSVACVIVGILCIIFNVFMLYFLVNDKIN